MKKHGFSVDLRRCGMIAGGCAILAFGMYEIHYFSGITEGGVLGMELLLLHWFHISPAVSGLLISIACYFYGWKMLGNEFIFYSAFGGVVYSIVYAVVEHFPPLWPQIGAHPLLAAIVGAIFVGVGAGLPVRAESAPGGDDALAMALSRQTGIQIQWIYLVTDLIVLGLSFTYIPLERIVYSLLTVALSGQIIGWVQRFRIPRR